MNPKEELVSIIYQGIVHGRTIELDVAPELPDGQTVTVIVQPSTNKLPPGEGLRRAFGSWAEDADELDRSTRRIPCEPEPPT